MKKLLTLLFAVALTFTLSSVTFAQTGDTAKKDETQKAEKAEKKASKKKAKKEKKTDKKEEKKDEAK